MSVKIDKLSEAIVFCLSSSPNTEFTESDILLKLCYNVCPEFGNYLFVEKASAMSMFEHHLRTIISEYPNIVVRVKQFTTYSYEKYHPRLRNIISRYEQLLKDIESDGNPDRKIPAVKFNDILENGETILHILVKESRYDLLEKFAKYYPDEINFTIKNNFDKQVFEYVENHHVSNLIVQLTENIKKECQEVSQTRLQNVTNAHLDILKKKDKNIEILYCTVIATVLLLLMLGGLFGIMYYNSSIC